MVINNHAVVIFQISNVWVNILMQRPKPNECGECEDQKINVTAL